MRTPEDALTQLIWWALTGVLHDAGITADPDAPVPAAASGRSR
jgi:hypothetical protein